VYPGLVPAAGATADGQLLTGLTPGEWRIIDAFEDGGYDLTELILTDGRPGWAYTLAKDSAALPSDWSPGEFAARHLAAYIERCAGWRHRHETGGPGTSGAPGGPATRPVSDVRYEG
jgi:hypothetical protein